MAEENKSDGKDQGNPDGGNSEFNNFQQLLKQVLSVPKEKIDEQRAKYEQEKGRGKQAG